MKYLMTALLLLGAIPAHAQTKTETMLKELTIEQYLGQQVPLDVPVRDEDGKLTTLRAVTSGKPVLFSFVYFDCPMLCGQVLSGITRAIKPMSLRIGEDYDLVSLSIDPKDTPEKARERKSQAVRETNKIEAQKNWHFLMADQPVIDQLTKAMGFRYAYDDESKQFAHPSGLFVLTPDGKISRVFYGIEYSSRDLRLALVEASQGKIGGLVDKILLFCFHYNPAAGKYGVAITRVMQAAGIATVAALAYAVVHMVRREQVVS